MNSQAQTAPHPLRPGYTDEGAQGNNAPYGMSLFSQKITEGTVLRVLVFGFLMMLIAMLVTGIAGIQSLRSVDASGKELIVDLQLTSSLITQAQQQMVSLSAVTHRLAKEPEAIDAEDILRLTSEADQKIDKISAAGEEAWQDPNWGELRVASRALTEEIERSLGREDVPIAATRTLFQKHQQLSSVVSALIDTGYERAIRIESSIDAESQRLSRETLWVFAGCFLLAVVFAVLTSRIALRLVRRIEDQTSELSRVSWSMLQEQETTAMRFSHELHDELGQSLTAVKANLAALKPANSREGERLRECTALLDQSIENVREMSHLLHPRILEDFGLDAALRALVERYSERADLRVEYESNVEGRLPHQTAIHLYRIAQEALTNVMKHSRASNVRISLRKGKNRVTLRIVDDGIGTTEHAGGGQTNGLGLIAMAARARHLGGKLKIGKAPSGGVSVEVEAPADWIPDGKEDSGSAG